MTTSVIISVMVATAVVRGEIVVVFSIMSELLPLAVFGLHQILRICALLLMPDCFQLLVKIAKNQEVACRAIARKGIGPFQFRIVSFRDNS